MKNKRLIKICGLRDTENIRAVSALGIDLTGFIFWPGSPRHVRTSDILPEAEPSGFRPGRVGVFVDQEVSLIVQTARQARLSHLQLHGHESPSEIARLREALQRTGLEQVGIIKAISVEKAADLDLRRYDVCRPDLWLFDTKCAGRGGSGKKFDWSVLESYHGPVPFLLSGGIGPGDAQALNSLQHPMLAGIDLNSRFETAPGIKDVDLLRDFIHQLHFNSSSDLTIHP